MTVSVCLNKQQILLVQEYVIRVYRGPGKDSWVVTKRYNDFALLDSGIKLARTPIELPPKKVFGNLDREFIAERQRGLQVVCCFLCISRR